MSLGRKLKMLEIEIDFGNLLTDEKRKNLEEMLAEESLIKVVF
jgi:hypothetical protein